MSDRKKMDILTDENGQEWFVDTSYALKIMGRIMSPNGDSMIVTCLDSEGREITLTASKLPEETEDDGA